MLRSLWNGASGMNAQAQKMDTLANNLANINTIGYKKNQANFQDLVYQALNKIGNPVNLRTIDGTPLQNGVGVKLASNAKLFSQGSLMETNRSQDLAITGKGFFGIQLDSGEIAYTRDGSFQLDSEGYISNSAGRLVLEPEIRITEDTKEIAISPTGEIAAVTMDGQRQIIGSVPLFNFTNPAGLRGIGQNLFLATDSSGELQKGVPGSEGFGVVRQGFLEMSNVDLAEELSQLIQTQRAYELNSRSIKTADEMWSMANSLKR